MQSLFPWIIIIAFGLLGGVAGYLFKKENLLRHLSFGLIGSSLAALLIRISDFDWISWPVPQVDYPVFAGLCLVCGFLGERLIHYVGKVIFGLDTPPTPAVPDEDPPPSSTPDEARYELNQDYDRNHPFPTKAVKAISQHLTINALATLPELRAAAPRISHRQLERALARMIERGQVVRVEG